MKTLSFYFRGEVIKVNEQGHIKANGLPDFSAQWIFKGGSRHHFRRGIDVTLEQAFAKPSLLENCYGWDVDHGTTRMWSGSHCGRIPRITNASVSQSTI